MSGSTTPAVARPPDPKRRSERVQLSVNERVKRGRAAVDAEGRALADAIKAEIAKSDGMSTWAGRAAEPFATLPQGDWATYRFDASDTVKQAIQLIGQQYGCHSCGEHAESDRDQPWTGDHCPPTKLPAAARVALNTSKRTHLFPQCKSCSDRQAGLVSLIASLQPRDVPMFVAAMPADSRKLLTGGRTPIPSGHRQNCVISGSKHVLPHEGVDIQRLGSNVQVGGCHTCEGSFPCPDYVADHVVPKFLVSEGFRQLFEMLDIPLTDADLRFRPQCQRCSNAQGGAVAQLAVAARAYGRKLGIVFDEDPSARVDQDPSLRA